jgi:hypothetical protein
MTEGNGLRELEGIRPHPFTLGLTRSDLKYSVGMERALKTIASLKGSKYIKNYEIRLKLLVLLLALIRVRLLILVLHLAMFSIYFGKLFVF